MENCVENECLIYLCIFNHTGIRTIFMCDHDFLVFSVLEENEWQSLHLYIDFKKVHIHYVILLMKNCEIVSKTCAL